MAKKIARTQDLVSLQFSITVDQIIKELRENGNIDKATQKLSRLLPTFSEEELKLFIKAEMLQVKQLISRSKET